MDTLVPLSEFGKAQLAKLEAMKTTPPDEKAALDQVEVCERLTQQLEKEFMKLQELSGHLTPSINKPAPIFVKGENLEIKGAYFRVLQILRDRLILRPVRH